MTKPIEGVGGDLRWSLRAVLPHVFQPVEDEVIERAKRQLVVVFLGMGRWDPQHSG